MGDADHLAGSVVDPGGQSSAPPSARHDRAAHPGRKHALQRRMVLCTLLLVSVPTGVCAAWLNQFTESTFNHMHAQNVAMLGQTIGAALAGELGRTGGPGVGAAVEALNLDSRLAFLIVTDPEGQVLHQHTADASGWRSYQDWQAAHDERGQIDLERPVFLGSAGDIVMRRVPIWEGGTAGAGTLERAAAPHLVGFAVLALREPALPAALAHLRAVQLMVVCLLCLMALPVVVWAVRRWTAPLRALVKATQQLAAGEQVEAVRVTGHDELAQLAEAFNQMAGSLWLTRRALQNANALLEEKVQDRTAQLERTTRRLESEIKDKDEFIRAVSHDLGAPLRNISGLTAMLLMKYKAQLADDAVNKLERIRANVSNQVELINDLMELSRLRVRPGKREQVDLHAMVLQIRDNLGYDLENSGIVLEIEGHLPTLEADRNRMRQVFQNLLDNAVKYMLDAEERRISVRCEPQSDMLHFIVSDTGCGIAPEDLTGIFDLFRRATRSGSHVVPGRGVGLTGVKTIVECYGGRIWAQSTLGKGSAFHFTFDRKLVSLNDAAVEADADAELVSA